MAERHSIWTGQLRLALVSCPVALYAAHQASGTMHFNLINPETGNRIRMVSHDAETGEEVARSELVKGYEYKKDSYLIVNEEDFDSARVESSSTMTIGKFVKTEAIDPIYFDNSYYIAPDDEAGRDVYRVLWDAIKKTGMAAISRVVIARRERPIAILPLGDGLIAHTLLEERDLNNPNALFEPMKGTKTDPEMVKLAVQLIERQVGKYDPADFEDRYEARLRDLIDAKLKGKGFDTAKEADEDRSNVIDLMAALRRSLGPGQDGKTRAKPSAAPSKARRASAPSKRSQGKAARRGAKS